MNICHANEKSSTELTIQCCHHTTGRRQNHFIQLSLDDPSETQKEEFTFEIEQMKMLGSHKNVVSMVGCCTHEEKMFLVIEYVPCGDLLTWLRRRRKKVRKSKKSHCSVLSCSESVDHHFLWLYSFQFYRVLGLLQIYICEDANFILVIEIIRIFL